VKAGKGTASPMVTVFGILVSLFRKVNFVPSAKILDELVDVTWADFVFSCNGRCTVVVEALVLIVYKERLDPDDVITVYVPRST
jgi:hypothetical protein